MDCFPSDISLLVQRNTTNFFMLILYLATLQIIYQFSKFYVEAFSFSAYSIMSSAYSDSFASSLPIWIPVIYLSICILSDYCGWYFQYYVENSGERQSCPDFSRKAFSFSLLSIILAIVLSWAAFIKICCLYIHFDESFYYECALKFIKWFFCIYWGHVSFVFTFVNEVNYIDRYTYVKSSLLSWNESNLIMFMIVGLSLLVICWFLHLSSSKLLAFNFVCLVFSGLGIRMMVTS